MLTVTIKSYDQHFDTYACSFKESDDPAFDSLIPATLLSYIAPKLVAVLDDLPFDAVGQSFTLASTGGSI